MVIRCWLVSTLVEASSRSKVLTRKTNVAIRDVHGRLRVAQSCLGREKKYQRPCYKKTTNVN